MAKRKNQRRTACPLNDATDVAGGQCKELILNKLIGGAMSLNQLAALLPDISNEMLLLQLGELEADELLICTVCTENSLNNKYELTNKGRSLEKAFHSLKERGEIIFLI
ncbi:MAG: winged helix-turn-helix transcriptional regulator [Gammaproteobacteria bacterium]|nr:winged helix-turn-helix transcriptional regulator [Gammaproteobacteria bacterium]